MERTIVTSIQITKKEDLIKIGLKENKYFKLTLTSEFIIEGIIKNICYHDNYLSILTWKDCKITYGDKVYFEPEWGEFDQIVTERVTALAGGAEDRNKYPFDAGNSPTSPGRTSPHNKEELEIISYYSKVRSIREKQTFSDDDLNILISIINNLGKNMTREWLLAVEIYEIIQYNSKNRGKWDLFKEDFHKKTDKLKKLKLFSQGLEIAKTKDSEYE